MKKGKIMTSKITLAALIGPWLLVQSYSLRAREQSGARSTPSKGSEE
jgi:hypothetical protein